MASNKKSKGVTKELATFDSWGKGEVIGLKVENMNGKTYVTEIWCKVCAKYKEGLKKIPTLKGVAVASIMAFTEGTNVVT